MKIQYFKQTKTKVGHQTKIIVALTHLLKLLKKISNVLKLSSLDKGEKGIKEIKELSKREDIIMTNADKGGAVVVVDLNDYIKEAITITYYLKIQH